uniref:uncharacterized protein LOC778553 isoform X1 n=1 Tax=Ciona intestinalis TaxID=7719 RepID=UPI000EF461F7|nr:uncharacterized protein LOC778553 isoform X1 [Ciona intestinalis]|eukprot:XP_026689794.1 uncharacterized protein LOC778553 isoform X1 [Ciona intestinalis]
MADVIPTLKSPERTTIVQNLADLLARDAAVVSSSDDVSENEILKEDGVPEMHGASIYSERPRTDHQDRMEEDQPFDLSTRRTSASDILPREGKPTTGPDPSETDVSNDEHYEANTKKGEFSRYLNGMMLSLNDLRLRCLLCDVIFKVQNETFHAHKAVMASCSEFCRKKFLPLLYSQDHRDSEILTLEIHNVSVLGFRLLLDFIYTGQLDINDVTASHIAQAAATMEMTEIADIVEKHARGSMNNYLSNSDGSPSKRSELHARSLPLQGTSYSQSLDLSVKPHCKKRTSWNGMDSESKENHCKPRRSSDSARSVRTQEIERVPAVDPRSPERGNPEIFNLRSGNGIINQAKQLSEQNEQTFSCDDSHTQHWKKKYHYLEHENQRNERKEHGSKGVYEQTRYPTKEESQYQQSLLHYSKDNSPNALAPQMGSGRSPQQEYQFRLQFNRLFNWMPPLSGGENLLAQRVSAFMQPQLASKPTLAQTQWANFLRKQPNNYQIPMSFRPDVLPFQPNFLFPRVDGTDNRNGWRVPFVPPPALSVINNQYQQSTATGTRLRSQSSTNTEEPMNVDTTLPPKLETKQSPIYINSESNESLPSLESMNTMEERRSSGSGEDKSDDTKSKPPCNTRVRATGSSKPYKCEFCDADFNRPANLKTHMRIHSGEKPFQCERCNARFVQVAHLRAHVLIHTGEKPYPCTVCGTKFRHLQTLKSHLRIHTGEKPYSCQECRVHFRHKSQLRLHLRQKHGIQTNTKKTYKQVPGLCSADICAHIRRAQEIARSQTKQNSNNAPFMEQSSSCSEAIKQTEQHPKSFDNPGEKMRGLNTAFSH